MNSAITIATGNIQNYLKHALFSYKIKGQLIRRKLKINVVLYFDFFSIFLGVAFVYDKI